MILLAVVCGRAHAGAWTTGPVEDLTGPGLTNTYETGVLASGYPAELRLVYGLWNSPDVQLDVYFDGVLVGSALADTTTPWLAAPATGVFDVTALVADQPATIDVVGVAPAPFLYGEAVIGSIAVVWDSDDDADGVGGLVDCDDTDEDVFPGADERCNLVDDDCDGQVDAPDPVDPQTVYVDADGDAHGDPLAPLLGCPGAPGTAIAGDDCDDGDDTVHPGAPETCGGVDQDCDGDVDLGAVDAQTYTRDDDGDGVGGELDAVAACAPPAGYGVPGDCDDSRAETLPGADEACNGIDDDCDVDVDEDAVDAITLYLDGDEDGFGGFDAVDGCPGLDGTSVDGGDCDDGDADVFPGAPEGCDGIDQDCDGAPDDDPVDAVDGWADADGDGWGDPAAPGRACPSDPGWAEAAGDCDDGDGAVNPDAEERCNAVDDDCDDLVDDDPVDAVDRFVDADHDGWGDPDQPIRACTSDAASDRAGDCDDGDPTVYPDAPGYGPDCKPLEAEGCGCDTAPAGAPGAAGVACVGAWLARRRRAARARAC